LDLDIISNRVGYEGGRGTCPGHWTSGPLTGVSCGARCRWTAWESLRAIPFHSALHN